MKFRVEFGFAENVTAVEEWQTIDGLDVVEAENAEGAAKWAACMDGLETVLFRVFRLQEDEFGGLEKVGEPEFYSFYDEPERQTLEIYCNYGALAAEKRNVYTYGAQHYNATCSDRMTVYVPEGWAAWDNPMGKTMVTAPWGWDYEVGEVLAGDKYPHFEAKDRDGNLRRYRLDGELHGDGVEDDKMMNKYELTGETVKLPNGETGYRIRALKDFADVKAGNLGGFVQSEKNLSQDGNAWVYDDAWVYNDAQVCGDAQVYAGARVRDNAQVCDNAKICDGAQIYGDAQVFGNAKISDCARIYGGARVYGDAWVSGNAEVYDNACVYENSRVYGDAQVYNNASIHGNAKVYGYSQVYDGAQVYDKAKVCGEAHVYDDAWVYGDARIYGDALVCGDSQVYGGAQVCDDAKICDGARVFDNVKISGCACVSGNAQVFGDVQV